MSSLDPEPEDFQRNREASEQMPGETTEYVTYSYLQLPAEETRIKGVQTNDKGFPGAVWCQPIVMALGLVVLVEIGVIITLGHMLSLFSKSNTTLSGSVENHTNPGSVSGPGPLCQHHQEMEVKLKDLCNMKGKCELCPNDWVQHSGKCYYISKERKNWNDSRSFCLQIKSRLAVFDQRQGQEFRKNHTKEKQEIYWVECLREENDDGCRPQQDEESHCCILNEKNITTEHGGNVNKWICEKNVTNFTAILDRSLGD
ncbi:killer cell lectin-like receptor subfamily F member 1 [Microcaecilia unicolor]|uniref:Killer cell lectin-like receptor subfamily F member 1 n=1 Tax=Microcaecilia unicolor TaxID=1415580 RepID=A0A6P7WZL8_9AMPH|nr:killer cell lectin-like receptor subfamily F member 1 [Microcaecilia unicolor]